MTETTDQFADLTRRGHEMFAAAAQAWQLAVRTAAGAAGLPRGELPDVGATVDAAFDFAAQMLADQRDFTRTLMNVGSHLVSSSLRPATAGPDPGPAAAPAVATSAREGSPARAEASPAAGPSPDGATPAVPPRDRDRTHPAPRAAAEDAGTTDSAVERTTPPARSPVKNATAATKTTDARNSTATTTAPDPHPHPGPDPAADPAPAPGKRTAAAAKKAAPRAPAGGAEQG